jgi:hypothetical protein
LNAVEIEEAISALAEQPFDAQQFPFAFLQAFGNKETTLKRLRKGESNKSDLGGILQTNNIHIAVAASGEVTKILAALKASPATAKAKAKFTLATDGDTFEAEDLTSGATVACSYKDFPRRSARKGRPVVMGHNRTHAAQHDRRGAGCNDLLDHFVSSGEQHGWYG